MNFSVNSRITEILRVVQIYSTSLKLKTGSMVFNKIWYQQYSFTGVDIVLHFISNNLHILRYIYCNVNRIIIKILRGS